MIWRGAAPSAKRTANSSSGVQTGRSKCRAIPRSAEQDANKPPINLTQLRDHFSTRLRREFAHPRLLNIADGHHTAAHDDTANVLNRLAIAMRRQTRRLRVSRRTGQGLVRVQTQFRLLRRPVVALGPFYGPGADDVRMTSLIIHSSCQLPSYIRSVPLGTAWPAGILTSPVMLHTKK
jgi:hypothetical protein